MNKITPMNKEFIDRAIAVITGEIFLIAAFMNLDFSNYMPHFIAFALKCVAAAVMAFIGGFLSVVGKDFWYYLKNVYSSWRKSKK